MAHFAELDSSNVVLRVIVADTKEWCEQNLGGVWIQTSYNTYAGVHLLGGEPLHKNYAGIGFIFDGVGFYPPKPFPSWLFNEETYLWKAPVEIPNDSKPYKWDEELGNWIEA